MFYHTLMGAKFGGKAKFDDINFVISILLFLQIWLQSVIKEIIT